MVNEKDVRKGLVFTSPRWKGDRLVTLVAKVRYEGEWIDRVEYTDLRTSRSGWATLKHFAAMATPKDLVSAADESQGPAAPMNAEALIDAGVRLQDVPADERAAYFVRVGDRVLEGVGFRSILQADHWIGLHRADFDWRGGNVFRLKGLRLDIAIVDRNGIVLG